MSGSALLEAAAAIGARLASDACWSGARCSWMGRALGESESGPTTVKPIGGDLYLGTAGVGLFLAEFSAAGGDATVRRTAVGALEHARWQAARMGRPVSLGFHSGAAGIAHALTRGGRLLGRDDLAGAGLELGAASCADASGDGALDFIGGAAGAIIALLELEMAGTQSPLLALRLAERLLLEGTRDGDALSWAPSYSGGSDAGARPLTGLAHGAAGMGLALLIAGRRFGRPDLIEAGEAAFRYESRWFDPAVESWADLREPDLPGPTPGPRIGAMAWCHGAPGIGLSRLRALQLSPGVEPLRAEAWAAVRSTQRCVLEILAGPPADCTPCHGLAGLLELLLDASSILGEPSLAVLPREAWQSLIASHGSACDWPSGDPSGGFSPSLMIGLAGVGYSMLRVARTGTPSILLPGLTAQSS